MPTFWDYIHINRPEDTTSSTGHKLQDGLFQIASSTCGILVQVNNTNIIYGDGGTNVNYNQFGAEGSTSSSSKGFPKYDAPSSSRETRDVSFSKAPSRSTKLDHEQSVELLGQVEGQIGKNRRNLFASYKHRLSVSAMGRSISNLKQNKLPLEGVTIFQLPCRVSAFSTSSKFPAEKSMSTQINFPYVLSRPYVLATLLNTGKLCCLSLRNSHYCLM